jgi:hypothetical protein
MKVSAIALLLLVSGLARGQDRPAPTLKSVLLAQLKSTHNEQDWFVPCIKALDGLTAEQAMWKEGNADHSIAQLTSHLTFWNARQLAKFTGAAAASYNGNNEETFTPVVDAAGWSAAVQNLTACDGTGEKRRRTPTTRGFRPGIHHRAHQHPQRVSHGTDPLHPQAAGLLGPGEGRGSRRRRRPSGAVSVTAALPAPGPGAAAAPQISGDRVSCETPHTPSLTTPFRDSSEDAEARAGPPAGSPPG